METMLKVGDGLKRILGYLDDDPLLDEATQSRMEQALTAAEYSVQTAIGDENADFYSQDEVKKLYTLACNGIAANWFNHPSSATVSTTAEQIIGQLRGFYAEAKEADEDGTTTKR